MDKHQKVFILAADERSAGKICDKLNRSRPVQAEYFLEIKEFLSATLAESPDFLVVSMEYHHPRVENFPTVFRSATGKPVIASTESAQPEFSRLVNRSKADLKISGKMNAHNLWVKILSYNKEENNKKLLAIKDAMERSKTPTKSKNLKQGDPLSQDGSGHTHVRAEKIEAILKDLNKGREGNKEYSPRKASEDRNSGFFNDKGRSTKTKTSKQSAGTSEPSENKFNFSFGHQDDNRSKVAPADLSNSQSTQGSSYQDDKQDTSQSRQTTATALKSRSGEEPSELDRRLGNPRSAKAPSTSADNVDSPKTSAASNTKDSERSLSPIDTQNPAVSSSSEQGAQTTGSSASARSQTGKPTSENAAKLSLEKGKKETKKNTKNIDEKKEQKNASDLSTNTQGTDAKLKTFEDACRRGLRETLNGTPLEESPDFESTNLMVIAVDQKDFKGYLLLANSFDAVEEPSVLLELKSNIQIELETQGLTGDLADIVTFQVDSVPFSQWSSKVCEFAIHGEMPSGKQYCLSFLPRKKVIPPYKMADDRTRIMVNLQHIPPGTNVNFNGYIFLERNNRYVCVLKKGGSICLDQIKRFMKNEKYQNFHIPVEDKKSFFQFYIHNRVNWEFVTYLRELKEDEKNKAA